MTILCKFLVVGPNADQIDKIISVLACREVEGDVYSLNRYRPSSRGPIGEAGGDKYYWETYWALPKNIYEKKFGPFREIPTSDSMMTTWLIGNKNSKPIRPKNIKQKKVYEQQCRPFQVTLTEEVIQSLKKKCAELGVSVARYMGACACYLLDYARVDKNNNPSGFNEIINVLSADTDGLISESDPLPEMELKFVKRKPEIDLPKKMRDYIVDYLLDDPTPDHFIAKKDLAEKMGTTTKALFTEKNREEYDRWERMFENLKDGNLEQTYSPEVSFVIKEYLKKKPEKFIKKYEIAERLGTTAIKLFNMKTPDCEKNRREYDRWKKKFQEGNY